MEIGIYTFAECGSEPSLGMNVSPGERLRNLVEEIVAADRAGLDWFGVGEHHRADYAVSVPAIALAAAAPQTQRIRLSSAVSVLGSDDPVRVFEEFAMLDNLTGGRAEVMAGRGAFVESFPLHGLDLRDYEALFAEKLALLLALAQGQPVRWPGGRHTRAVEGQPFPRPVQVPLPVWLATGGTPDSVVRAAELGLPLAVGIIGGDLTRFRPLFDLYRRAWDRAGRPAAAWQAALNVHGFVAETDRRAADIYSGPHNAVMTRLGAERGWPPATRAGFDAQTGPNGALFVGSPAALVDKILAHRETFGFTRIALQMGVGLVAHRDMMEAIEILGTRVAPELRRAAAA